MTLAPEPVQPASTATPTAPKRWGRRKIIGIVLAIFAMGGLGFVGFKLAWREAIRAKGNRALNSALAEADRTDPDWTWDRVNAGRRVPPPGQNAAELIPRIWAATNPEWEKRQAAYDPQWQAKIEIPPNCRFSPSVLAVARRDLAASAEAVRLARTLKQFPHGRRDLVLPPNYLNINLEDTDFTRTVAALLRWDVVLAIEDGDRGRAADGLLASLNASRSIGDEPLLVSQVTRGSIRTGTIGDIERALAQVDNLPGLVELQTALAAEEPLLLYGFRGERAALDQLFANLQTGVATRDSFRHGVGKDSAWWRFAWWHYRGWLPGDRAFALAWMTRCVELAKLPVHEQIAPLRAMQAPGLEEQKILSTLLLKWSNPSEGYWRHTATARCADVGIACERFRQQHKRWPESLAELVPTFLPAVPLDPYNAEPLRYAKLNAGVVVYSVGKDLRGDGGTLETPDSPQNTHPRFRLWNPDQRRLPAPPDPPDPPAEP